MIKTYRNTTRLPEIKPEESQPGDVDVSTPGIAHSPFGMQEIGQDFPGKSCSSFLQETPDLRISPLDNDLPQTSQTWRLGALRDLIRQCADPRIRLIERHEANSLCLQVEQAKDGLLLNQVAGLIRRPAQTVQNELLKMTRQPALKIAPFLSQLRTTRLAVFMDILSPLGIIALLRNDRLLTVLAELPTMAPLVICRCREENLPIYWCHVVTINLPDLVNWGHNPDVTVEHD